MATGLIFVLIAIVLITLTKALYPLIPLKPPGILLFQLAPIGGGSTLLTVAAESTVRFGVLQ